MKNYRFYLIIFLLSTSLYISGCDSLFIKNSTFDCNYNFMRCENGKVEKTYKNHTARIKKITDSNNFPSPYNLEFYIIDLDPNNESSLESHKTLVIPCGDLPLDLREDGLLVKVSGDQMSCTIVPKDSPDKKYIGQSLFNIRSVKSM